MPAEEQRIDPEDGKTQTLTQLHRKYSRRNFAREDIEEYWRTTCVPIEGSPGGGNDPFETHQAQQPRAPAAAQEALESVRDNPFLTHQRGPESRQGEANVREDPFMTHGQYMSQEARDTYREGSHRARRQQLLNAATALRRGWGEGLQKLLGPGAPDRKLPARNALILGPWLMFMWMVLVWILLQHYSVDCCVLLTAALCGACFFMVFAWHMGKRWGPVSLLPLGMLCLVAVVMGVSMGRAGWQQHWRAYWWMQTGLRTMDTSASTSAAARADSAVIEFNSNGQTRSRTLIDDTRAAGYKEGSIYCVAPVMSPETAGSSAAVVNYWAIGIDCCSDLGSFTCDASRSHKGGFGVVMLDAGYPCPGCHSDKYKAAVAKAEAMHGLVSAPGALYVRWVADLPGVEFGMLMGSLTFVLLSAFFGFVTFFFLGSIFWYWDIGNRSRESDPLLAAASRSKLPAV